MSAQQELISEALVFQQGDTFFAVEISFVERIVLVREEAMIELPRTPKYILGALSLENRIIPLLDLEIYLGWKEERNEFTITSNAILLKTENLVYAVFSGNLPKKVNDIQFSAKKVERDDIPKEWVKGTLTLDEKTQGMLLDPEELWVSLQTRE